MSKTLVDSADELLQRLIAAKNTKQTHCENWKSPLGSLAEESWKSQDEQTRAGIKKLRAVFDSNRKEFERSLDTLQRTFWNSCFYEPDKRPFAGHLRDRIFDIFCGRKTFVDNLGPAQQEAFNKLRDIQEDISRRMESAYSRDPDNSKRKILSVSMPGELAEASPEQLRMIERVLNGACGRAHAKLDPEDTNESYVFVINAADMAVEMFVDRTAQNFPKASAVTLENIRDTLQDDIRRDLADAGHWRRGSDGTYQVTAKSYELFVPGDHHCLCAGLAFDALCGLVKEGKANENSIISRLGGKELSFVAAAQKKWHERRGGECRLVFGPEEGKVLLGALGVDAGRVQQANPPQRGRG